jgi:hypothetical protein
MRIFQTTVIVFFALLFKVQSGYALESLTKGELPTWSQRPEEDLYIIALTLDRYTLSEGMATYINGTEILMPLGALARALEFPITVYPETGTAKGWFFNDDILFSLDMRSGLVNLAGQKHRFDPTKLERLRDDIYVSTSELEIWFPIRFNLRFQSQKIEIKAFKPLPIEQRIAREKRQAELTGYHTKKETIPYVEPESDFFEWPFVDVSMSASSRKTGFDDESGISQTTTIAGVIGDLDAEATLFTRENSIAPDVRMRFGRQSLDGDLLGPLNAHEYAFGDVATPSLSLISDNIVGRGVMVSSFDLDSLNETNQITLRGNLPLGWEVEIYRNQELIGFQNSQDVGSGRYEFQDIPTVIGLNVFRLVFFVTPEFSKPGQTSFRIAVNQADKDIISFEDPEYSSVDVGKGRFIFQAEHGLTETTSVQGGLASISLYGERHNYFSGGIRTSIAGNLVNFDLGIDQAGGVALGGTLQARLDSWSVTAEQRWFQDFVSEKSEDLSINGEEIVSQSVLRLSGLLPDYGIFSRLPVSATVQHRIGKTGGWQTDLFGRVSYSHRPFNISVASNTRIEKDQNIDSGLQLIGSSIGKVRWRGELNIDPLDDRMFNSSSLFADWKLTDEIGASAGLLYSNADKDVASVRAGLYHSFNSLNLGFNVNADTERNYGISVGLSFSLGHHPMDQTVEMRGQQFARSGAVSAKVFLDKNNDGLFNPGDEPIENAQFSGGAVPNKLKTSGQGTAFIPGIDPYKPIQIALTESSLEDPSWRSAEPPKFLSLRPGVSTELLFPVVETGEVDGWILVDGNEDKPASGVKVKVVDRFGKKVAESLSAYDGYFFVGDIPYGDYLLVLDTQQLASIGYYTNVARPITIDDDDPFSFDQNFDIANTENGIIVKNDQSPGIFRDDLIANVAQPKSAF